MKKLIFLFLFQVSLTYSQQFNLTFSEEMLAGRNYAIDNILGKIDGDIYATRSEFGVLTKSKHKIRKYDSDYNIIFNKELTLPQDNFIHQGIFLRNDTIYTFLSHFDKDKNINYLYGSTISKEGTINQPLIELATFTSDNNRIRNQFLISENIDSSRFIVMYSPNNETNEEKNVQILSIDHQFTIINRVDINLPFETDNLQIYEVKATLDGNIHFLAGFKVDVGERKKKNTLRVLTYYKETKDLHEHRVEIDQNYITEYKFKFRENGNLILSGFYSDLPENRMKGIFFLEIDSKKREILNVKTTDFTTDFLKLFTSERKAEKGKELWHFRVRDIYIKDDGGIMFLAEHYQQYSTNFEGTEKTFNSSTNVVTTRAGGRSNTNHYDYGDIMVANMDRDGEISWWTKIPKLQNSTNDNGIYGGMHYSFRKDSIYMIFNDHEKNIEYVDPNYLRNLKLRKSWAVLVTINSKGEANKTPLFNSKKNKAYLMPKAGYKVNDNEHIIIAKNKRQFRLCEISFE